MKKKPGLARPVFAGFEFALVIVALALVHRLVGTAKQEVDRVVFLFHAIAAGTDVADAGDRFVDLLDLGFDFFFRHVEADGFEFVAAEAVELQFLVGEGKEDTADAFQRDVTRSVAEAVVDALEAVQVETDEGGHVVLVGGEIDVEGMAVQQTREGIPLPEIGEQKE